MSYIQTPHLLRHERIVLGALLQADGPSVAAAVADLPADAFTAPAHREIYWRLLVDHVEPEADAALATALDAVGGPDYLRELEGVGQSIDGPHGVASACVVIRRRWDERCQAAARGAR